MGANDYMNTIISLGNRGLSLLETTQANTQRIEAFEYLPDKGLFSFLQDLQRLAKTITSPVSVSKKPSSCVFQKDTSTSYRHKRPFSLYFCSFLEMTLCSNLPLALNRIIVRIFLKSLKHFFSISRVYIHGCVIFVTNLGKKDVIACIIRQAALSTKDPGLAPKMQTKSYLKAHFKMTCIIWLDFILDQGFEYSSCKIDFLIALKIGCLIFFKIEDILFLGRFSTCR